MQVYNIIKTKNTSFKYFNIFFLKKTRLCVHMTNKNKYFLWEYQIFN